jgi:hypothetical protein
MGSLLAHQSESEEEEEKRRKQQQQQARRPSNSSQMAASMNHENMAPKTSTRVRQAPGGQSSLVIG